MLFFGSHPRRIDWIDYAGNRIECQKNLWEVYTAWNGRVRKSRQCNCIAMEVLQKELIQNQPILAID